MKKIIVAVLSLVLALSMFTACSGKTDTGATDVKSTVAAQEKETGDKQEININNNYNSNNKSESKSKSSKKSKTTTTEESDEPDNWEPVSEEPSEDEPEPEPETEPEEPAEEEE